MAKAKKTKKVPATAKASKRYVIVDAEGPEPPPPHVKVSGGKAGRLVGDAEGRASGWEIIPARIASARRAFSSDAEIANALGVARSQLSRWKAGQSPDEPNRDKLVGLDAVIALLTGYLSESTIQKWLTSPNAHLGNRKPLTVLRANRLSEVIAAIEAEKSGAFA